MFLNKEVQYMPWETARRNLNYFYLMFDRSEVYGPMQVGLNHRHEHKVLCKYVPFTIVLTGVCFNLRLT